MLSRATLLVLAASAVSCALGSADSLWKDTVVIPITGINDFSTIMLASDEVSAFFIYDSADINSHRVVPQFATASKGLDGFARFYAIDTRDPELSWALDAWNVQIVPTIRGAAPASSKSAAAAAAPGGLAPRNVKEMQLERGLTETLLKKFVLGLQQEAPITRIDTDAKAKALHQQLTTPADNERASLVLLSDKPTSSQLFKAVAINYNGRCDAYDVYTKKATGATELFEAEKTPTLILYDRHGKHNVYTGAVTVGALHSFLEHHVEPRDLAVRTRLERATARMSRDAQRLDTPALRITTREEWETDVSDQAGISGVFFIAAESEAQQVIDAAREMRELAAEKKTPVGQLSWALRADAPALADVLTKQAGAEPAKAVFLNAKKGLFTRYDGEIKGKALFEFITGPLSRGVGAVPLRQLPQFGE